MRPVRQKAKDALALGNLARDFFARTIERAGTKSETPPRVKPGQLREIPDLERGESEEIYRAALVRACGGDRRAPERRVLWRDGDDEIVLHPGQATFATGDQLIVVAIPVFTDQSGHAQVAIPFVTNPANHDLGLIAATETKPRGPAAIIDVFGDALVAVAWAALVEVAAAWTEAAGKSAGQGPLSPAGLAATRKGLRIRAQGKFEPEER